MERKESTAALLLTAFVPLPKPAVKALAVEGAALLRLLENDATSFEVRLAA